MSSLAPNNNTTVKQCMTTLIKKIREDLQTIVNDCFKLQVDLLEDSLNPEQLLDLVTSLIHIMQMASMVIQLTSTECDQIRSFPTKTAEGTTKASSGSLPSAMAPIESTFSHLNKQIKEFCLLQIQGLKQEKDTIEPQELPITMSGKIKVKPEIKEEKTKIVTIKREKEDIIKNGLLTSIVPTNNTKKVTNDNTPNNSSPRRTPLEELLGQKRTTYSNQGLIHAMITIA
jgi:hypothetical protein